MDGSAAPFGDSGAIGEALDGLVRAEVDGAGRVLGVSLDQRAMRLPAYQVAEAVTAALREAQTVAGERAADAVARLGEALPSGERLAAAVEEASAAAERRLDEYSTALYDLSRRAGGAW